MEQLKVWDIGHIYAPKDERIHLAKAKVTKVHWDNISVETILEKQKWYLYTNEFVKSELYNNPKPMKQKAKPVTKKATPKQVWRPVWVHEVLNKWDILKQRNDFIYTTIEAQVEVTRYSWTNCSFFNCIMKDWAEWDYNKCNFLIARPLEVSVQYLRSDWLLFTKDKIGSDDVQHLKNEHKRIGDLLSAHKKYFK